MSRARWSVAAILVLMAALLLPGCGSEAEAVQSTLSSSVATPADSRETLYQYATLSALMAGVYDGSLTISELLRHGDQGLGTLNHLDGEMVVLDGKAYQIAYDGSVRQVSGDQLTPFAVTTDFDADIMFKAAAPMTFDELKAAIDRSRPSGNLPYAIRIEGTFASLKTRSVPAQAKPYRPLPEVLKEQSEFEFTDVKGTIVGFWLPEYMNGPNAGGYHLHFVTAARDGGGHVLDCLPADVTITLDETGEWMAELPTTGDFTSTDLSDEQYQ
jgi:acetolactate decarboxylase